MRIAKAVLDAIIDHYAEEGLDLKNMPTAQKNVFNFSEQLSKSMVDFCQLPRKIMLFNSSIPHSHGVFYEFKFHYNESHCAKIKIQKKPHVKALLRFKKHNPSWLLARGKFICKTEPSIENILIEAAAQIVTSDVIEIVKQENDILANKKRDEKSAFSKPQTQKTDEIHKDALLKSQGHNQSASNDEDFAALENDFNTHMNDFGYQTDFDTNLSFTNALEAKITTADFTPNKPSQHHNNITHTETSKAESHHQAETQATSTPAATNHNSDTNNYGDRLSSKHGFFDVKSPKSVGDVFSNLAKRSYNSAYNFATDIIGGTDYLFHNPKAALYNTWQATQSGMNALYAYSGINNPLLTYKVAYNLLYTIPKARADLLNSITNLATNPTLSKLEDSTAFIGSNTFDMTPFGKTIAGIGFFKKVVPHKTPLKSFKPGEAEAHFKKHGTELSGKFGFSSYTKEQYISDANHVIQHGKFVPELNGYVLTPSGKGSALVPFVGLDRVTGEITTLHLKPISFFERKAPSLGLEAKPRSELTDMIGENRELGYKSPYRSTF